MNALLSSTSYVDTQVVTDIGSLMSTVTGWISSNPYLTIFFTMTLVGASIGIFKAVKNAMVRH